MCSVAEGPGNAHLWSSLVSVRCAKRQSYAILRYGTRLPPDGVKGERLSLYVIDLVCSRGSGGVRRDLSVNSLMQLVTPWTDFQLFAGPYRSAARPR